MAINPTAAAYMVSAFSDLSGGISQSQGLMAQGQYTKKIAQTNAMLAENQAQDAIRRGQQEAFDLRKRGRQVAGAQRAALAAQGLDIGFGSAADAQLETYQLSELDAMRIRNNAFREAWGYRMNAANAAAGGQFAELSANNMAANTLLTGGMRSISSGLHAYSEYKKV